MKKGKLIKEYEKINDKIKIYGLENIDTEKINIFLPNHSCILDSFLVPYAINYKTICIVSSNSLFGRRDEERKRMFKELLYSFPLETRAKPYTEICIKYIKEFIKNKNDIIIFPQGVFDDSDYIYRARTGVIKMIFELLKENNLDINLVPVAIDINVENINRTSIKPWDNFNVEISFLENFDYDKYFNEYLNANNYEEVHSILHKTMDNIMLNISNKLNKKYIKEYRKQYFMDGFFTPKEECILFSDMDNEELKREYDYGLNELFEKLNFDDDLK